MSLWSYLLGVGMAEDETLDAVTGGPPNETFSMRWAKARAAGSRMGCIICAALSVLVQRNHCAKQLAGHGMSGWEYLRAFLCITIALAAPLALIWWAL
jgi:hypothetical protein